MVKPSGTRLNLSVSILLFKLYLRYFSLIIPAEIPALSQDKSCSDTVLLRSLESEFASNLHEKSGYLFEQSVTASDIDTDLRASFERSLSDGSTYADFLGDYFFPAEESDESDLLGLARNASLKESGRKTVSRCERITEGKSVGEARLFFRNGKMTFTPQ
jgi:hypothetical protein